ncbi:MAG: hypothetical protein L0241_00175 [Planctomycetia bacterium]|nr:hypothetical protein [Planctomycetia bacterium]
MVRFPKAERGKAWRAMIEIGPVRLIASDPIYEVLPAHVEMLTTRGFCFELVTTRPRPTEKRRHGTAN